MDFGFWIQGCVFKLSQCPIDHHIRLLFYYKMNFSLIRFISGHLQDLVTFDPRRTVLLLGRGRQAESVMPSATEMERTTCISSREYI